MHWAKPPQTREQMVLFSTRLDDAIPHDHTVRLLDAILSQIDWSSWEKKYHLKEGRPPIHPRVLCAVILHAIMNRIRSSRQIEQALEVRLDFLWLAEGRSIDHTTICKFRRKHKKALENLFIQIGLLAHQLDCLSLETLAFDGTRMRANNGRHKTRTPDQLRETQQELRNRYHELEEKMDMADAKDEETFGDRSPQKLSEELADTNKRQKQIEAGLAELKRLEENGKTVPNQMPTSDPDSRVMPNKEGGFAPNFTPLATVDVASGLIVSFDVIAEVNEDKHLISAIKDVQEQFGLEEPPSEMLADGLSATGENMAQCEALGVEFYAPMKSSTTEENPAIREDLTQPVSAEDRDKLPTKMVNHHGEKTEQLDKQAFVYDAENDCYWCPEGKQLTSSSRTKTSSDDGERQRRSYRSQRQDCAECPLAELCIQSKSGRRMVVREKYEEERERHAEKMSTDEAKEKYKRRFSAGERPFGIIKHVFGARQFLTRGLAEVKQEWRWLTTAYNLFRLMNLLRTMSSGTDPPQQRLGSVF